MATPATRIWSNTRDEAETSATQTKKPRFDCFWQRSRWKQWSWSASKHPFWTEEEREEEEKEKEAKPDWFQNLIRIFDIVREPIWKQRNKDRHQPGNKTNLSATIKVDSVVRGLYSMMNQVCVDDQDKFFNLDLDERLEQSVPSKGRWVNRFWTTIFQVHKEQHVMPQVEANGYINAGASQNHNQHTKRKTFKSRNSRQTHQRQRFVNGG